jgi:hypothetical protein
MTLALTFALKDQFEDTVLPRYNIHYPLIPRMKGARFVRALKNRPEGRFFSDYP